jgi:hypothetical protein
VTDTGHGIKKQQGMCLAFSFYGLFHYTGFFILRAFSLYGFFHFKGFFILRAFSFYGLFVFGEFFDFEDFDQPSHLVAEWLKNTGYAGWKEITPDLITR